MPGRSVEREVCEVRHRMRRSFVLQLLIVATIGLVRSAHASSELQAHIQIHVTVPETAAVPTELVVDRVEFVGRIATYPFTPARPLLASEELRGRFPLFLDAAIPADLVDSVRVTWKSAAVRIDAALTEPTMEGRTTSFALGRQYEAGSASVHHLHWDPDATDPAAETWMPRLWMEEPVAPPVTTMLLVSQEASGTVAIVDRRTGVVVDAIATGGSPRGLTWSAAQQRLFVAVGRRDEVVAVDLGGQRIVRRIPLDFGDEPTRLSISTDGTRLYVLCPGRDALVILSTVSLQENARVLLAPGVVAIAEDPRTGRVFVSSARGRSIEVVDPLRGAVVHSFPRPEAPGEIAFVGEEEGLAVAARDGRTLELVDPVTGAGRFEFTLCGPVRGLAYQARTDRLHAVLDLCDEVSILRPARGLEFARLTLPAAGGLPAIDPEDRTLFVPLPEQSAVLGINTSHGRDARRIETAGRPYQVVVP